MKKIKYAWIEQIIEFDSEESVKEYLDKLKHPKKPMKYSYEVDGLTVRVRKQYNNNDFPER